MMLENKLHTKNNKNTRFILMFSTQNKIKKIYTKLNDIIPFIYHVDFVIHSYFIWIISCVNCTYQQNVGNAFFYNVLMYISHCLMMGNIHIFIHDYLWYTMLYYILCIYNQYSFAFISRHNLQLVEGDSVFVDVEIESDDVGRNCWLYDMQIKYICFPNKAMLHQRDNQNPCI